MSEGMCVSTRSTDRDHIDHILKYENRSFRTFPGRFLAGSGGARLFADYLDASAGFAGRIDFIHKRNMPSLFRILCEGMPEIFEPVETVWHPSHLFMRYETRCLVFEEIKFITWQDQAVSCQRWQNKGKQTITLKFEAPVGFTVQECDGCLYVEEEEERLGFRVIGAICSDNGIHLSGSLQIAPGKSAVFMIAAAMGESLHDDRSRKNKEAQECVRIGKCGAPAARLYDNRLLSRHMEEYDRWFDDVPVFECDDPLYNRTWWYRWFILRNNYAEPGCGNMKHGTYYEGRSHKKSKRPFSTAGHEFSQLIPLSTPLQLMDARWKKGRECNETILSLLDSADENGVFRTMKVDSFGTFYTNFCGWALYELEQVTHETDFIRQVLPGFKKYVRGVWKTSKNGPDDLPVVYDHKRTGKEYQPSFWYFKGYPEHNVKDKNSFTPLKRVDAAVYLYLNALGVQKLCEIVEDEEAAEFQALAERLKSQILDLMWDEETSFFYDLHYETEERALVKNVVGIYPLWAKMTGEEHLKLLDYFFSPKGFATGSGFASTAADGPVFQPQGGWKGELIKGRNGCVWNGPSWPYTTSVALDAIGTQSSLHGHRYDAQFGRYLREYSLQHFRDHSLDRPYLVEHYDCVTGEMLSDEADYNHSWYIDLIIRHVAGISPEWDGIRISPLDIGLKSFELSRLYVNGYELEVSYIKGEHYAVYADGILVFQSKGLTDGFISYKDI